ncbi:hypothetical protein MBRA_20150 [Mycobacterium branderi]|uniref:Uncharacterized protein n=1 Tax=Mycobacterium branderi TaxID=43348 RepID=A0ABM7KLG5_9MYCO|nr:hypothetical protein MBRA_20150 [Mycobacterium branderi]
MTICRIGRNPDAPRRFPDSERVRPTRAGQLEAGVNQCRAQITVVVTQLLTLLGPEVYGVNITNVDGVNMTNSDEESP